MFSVDLHRFMHTPVFVFLLIQVILAVPSLAAPPTERITSSQENRGKIKNHSSMKELQEDFLRWGDLLKLMEEKRNLSSPTSVNNPLSSIASLPVPITAPQIETNTFLSTNDTGPIEVKSMFETLFPASSSQLSTKSNISDGVSTISSPYFSNGEMRNRSTMLKKWIQSLDNSADGQRSTKSNSTMDLEKWIQSLENSADDQRSTKSNSTMDLEKWIQSLENSADDQRSTKSNSTMDLEKWIQSLENSADDQRSTKSTSTMDLDKWIQNLENSADGQRSTKSNISDGVSKPAILASSFSDGEIKNRSTMNLEKWIQSLENSVDGQRLKESLDVHRSDSTLKDSRIMPTIAPSTANEEQDRIDAQLNVDRWVESWEKSVNGQSQITFGLPEAKDQKLSLDNFFELLENDKESHPSTTLTSIQTSSEKLSTGAMKTENEISITNEMKSKMHSVHSKTDGSIMPTNKANHLQQTMHLKDNSLDVTLDERDEFQKPVSIPEENNNLMLILFVVGCFCVAILIIVLLVCLCYKKQADGWSTKVKQLTTMNTDGNRIDLQILRPSKKSINAFTFGLPISTVEETLRNVVVDPPVLKY